MVDMPTKHLWEIEHPYYCSESNYYRANTQERYASWKEFIQCAGYDDHDLNLLFRFDWELYEDGTHHLELFFMLQRKGIFRPVEVIVRETDEDIIKEWLSSRYNHVLKLWDGVA